VFTKLSFLDIARPHPLHLENFSKDAVYVFSKADYSAMSKPALNELQNKEKLLILVQNQEFWSC